MVAVEETYAERFCTGATPPAAIGQLCIAPTVLFATATEDSFSADLATLEARLGAAKISYRIFTTLVALRETKMQ